MFGVDGLCAYEWKVAVGDTLLTLAELEALAELTLPLVKARGRWIALRSEDVEMALRFFKGRRARGRATAAELLREGLGVQAGQAAKELPEIEIEAEGWLGELLKATGDRRLAPVPTPSSFVGVLRPYQQRGLAWLSFAPSLTVHVHYGRERLKGPAVALTARRCDLVITTYALALRDRETLQSITWERVVLDEAQNIKTRDAKQTRAIVPCRPVTAWR